MRRVFTCDARMEIRDARPEDVPTVLPMVEKICALHRAWDPAKYGFVDDVLWMYDSWLHRRAEDSRSVFLVAAHPQRGAIGFLVGTIESEIRIYRLREYGFIHDVFIEEEFRHEGLARQLVTLAIEKFRGLGVEQIRLDTAVPNAPARALFESCGFRPSVTEMLLET